VGWEGVLSGVLGAYSEYSAFYWVTLRKKDTNSSLLYHIFGGISSQNLNSTVGRFPTLRHARYAGWSEFSTNGLERSWPAWRESVRPERSVRRGSRRGTEYPTAAFRL